MVLTLSNPADETATFAGSPSEVMHQLELLKPGHKLSVVAVTMPDATEAETIAMAETFNSLGPVVRQITERHRRDALNSIVEAIVPRDVPTATALVEARMLAESKRHVINTKSYVTAREIAEMAGYSGTNPSSQPNRWKRDRLIFAFNHGGVDYFPVYGLNRENGWKPYPAMATILKLFGDEKGGWGAAFWFEGVNGYLGGKTPKELLATDPERVIEAATLEMAPIAHA